MGSLHVSHNYDDFDSAWACLARCGHADDLGGAEYRRVRRAWVDAGRPHHSPGRGFGFIAALLVWIADRIPTRV
jgi:hypothetical protein